VGDITAHPTSHCTEAPNSYVVMDLGSTRRTLRPPIVTATILVTLLFTSCTKSPVDVAKISNERPSSPSYQSDLLTLERAPNEPLKIEGIRRGDSGDIQIDVSNISSKTIIFAGYHFSPRDDCPKSNHPLSFWVGYGDWKMLGRKGDVKIDPPIPPNRKVTMTIPLKMYRVILQEHKFARCLDSAKPGLTLGNVAFSDGAGWEGLADGPDHSEWNGRPWIPERK
jgi:hypothetical protein